MNSLVKVAAIVAIATLSINSIAQPRPGEGQPGMEHMFQSPAEALGLSTEQEDQIDAIRAAAQAETEDDRARMEELHQQLRELEGAFDAGTVQSIADEMGQITARLIYTRAETGAALNAVLTEEQQAALEELRQSMEGRHGNHKGGHHGQGEPREL